MNEDYLEISFLKLSQPIGDFFIGTINWKDLIDIAEADIRKIEEEDRKDDSFDSYLGIQRKISPKRINEIGQYVTNIDATFPTSIILHIDSETQYLDNTNVRDLTLDEIESRIDDIITVKNVIIDKENSKLSIRRNKKIARILDGQHRIEGLRNGFSKIGEDEIPQFEFNVTIFIDLDIDDQAQIFSIINKAQTKVNNSLVYDLYEYAKSRSPQKTSHDIVRLLNKLEDSPFYKKIKILGIAESETETLAQATFVDLIIRYISNNPMKDRDTLKRKSLFGRGKLDILTDEKMIEKYPFRNLFIYEKDEIIMKILWDYFKAVQLKWGEAWDHQIQGNILNKSTGLIALMRFLKPVISFLKNSDKELNHNEFVKIFGRIDLSSSDFDKDTFIPGSSGQSDLYYKFLEESKVPVI